jgi:hypothetical protein
VNLTKIITALRERFVLTRHEKKALWFLIAAFALGLATMHYRTKHPRVAPAPEVATDTRKKPVAKFQRVSPPPVTAPPEPITDDPE